MASSGRVAENGTPRLFHVALRGGSYGGVEAASNLFSRALRDWADRREPRYNYERIELAGSSVWQKVRGCARVLLAQRGNPRAVLFFDHIGPARLQAIVPATWRRPYAVFLHGIEVWGRPRRTAAVALTRADLLLSNSDYTRRRASQAWPALPSVAVVALALVDEESHDLLDRPLVDALPTDFFVMVGRMDPQERYKGHDLVLEALAALKQRGQAAQCVIAGEGADRARLEHRAGTLGIADRVRFTGRVSVATLVALYRRSRALVLPSTGEGFGLVYLEAMRFGRPCVAARGGAAEEIVIHGETGLLVDPGDVAALEEALLLLARGPALAERLGRAGRRRWEALYTETQFRARFNAALERGLPLASV